jgi:hypothetical protein
VAASGSQALPQNPRRPRIELVSMMTFLGGALALSAGAVLARYWYGLVPEGEKLKALVSQFEQTAP